MTTSKASRPKSGHEPGWDLFKPRLSLHINPVSAADFMHEDAGFESSFDTICSHYIKGELRSAVVKSHQIVYDRVALRFGARLEGLGEEAKTASPNPPRANILEELERRVDREIETLKQQYEEQRSADAQRIERLEKQVAALTAMLMDGEVETDPYKDWIQNHSDTLKQYRDMWVALDPQRGIVLADVDFDKFSTLLSQYSEEEQEAWLTFHTSRYG